MGMASRSGGAQYNRNRRAAYRIGFEIAVTMQVGNRDIAAGSERLQSGNGNAAAHGNVSGYGGLLQSGLVDNVR
jgi:hypothetical protein